MKHELENGNPTPEAIRDVVAKFDTLPEEFQLDMSAAQAHPCGTVACFAGAYAISRGTECETDFTIGAKWLAEDMGFTDDFSSCARSNLEGWAHRNDDIWGGSDGKYLFFSPRAFNLPGNQQPSLAHIKKHLLGVADRIEALDNKEGE